MIDLVIPTTFSKRESPYGRGNAAVGRRIADVEDDVSKAIATPMAPKGPVKKAPVSARTGPMPPKAAMTPPASRLATLAAVTKRDVPQAARKRAASKGDALPGGKFPIRNRTDLTHAKEDLGFVHGKEKSAAERLIARRSRQLVSKASGLRYETAEDRRQRRLGAAAGATGIGGALQASRGVRQVRADTAAARRGKVRIVPGRKVSDETRGRIKQAAAKLNNLDERGTAVVRPRAAGRLAAGGALLGASAGLMREHHKRSWN